MSEETDTGTGPGIPKEDILALARALFKVQNRPGKSEAGAEGEKPSFKEAKAEMIPLARRTLKLLHARGYVLSKAADQG
jgi:hypothetical protein